MLILSLSCLVVGIITDATRSYGTYQTLYVTTGFVSSLLLWMYIADKESKVKKSIMEKDDEPSQGDEVASINTEKINFSSLNFHEKKKLAKMIAEDAYYHFLDEKDLSGYEFDLEMWKYASGKDIKRRIIITPPKTTLVTIPSYVKRKKAQIKLINAPSVVIEEKTGDPSTMEVHQEKINIVISPPRPVDQPASATVETPPVPAEIKTSKEETSSAIMEEELKKLNEELESEDTDEEDINKTEKDEDIF